MEHHGIKIRSIIAGILIFLAGVLLFLFNGGIIPMEYKYIVFSWQSLLIVIGFINLFSSRKWGWGFFLMLLGGFFMLQKLNIPSLAFITQNGWAIGMIAAGIIILCKAIWGRHFCHVHRDGGNYPGDGTNRFKRRQSRRWGNHRKAGSGFIDYNYVFGGSSEKVDTKEFRGGEINCVFGGIELDLSDSQLAEGTNILEINSVFGGVVLYVPIEWSIEIPQNHIFGSFVDNRPKPNFEVDENRRLVIKASSFFGGGEIKCINK